MRTPTNFRLPDIPKGISEELRVYITQLHLALQYFRMDGVKAINESNLEIRKAYVDGTPGANEYFSAFLDTDTTGTPITVYVNVAGGSAMNEAIPRLEDGDPIPVWFDNADNVWRAFFNFQATAEC